MSLIAQSLLELFSSWATQENKHLSHSRNEGFDSPSSEKTETSVASHLAFHRLYSGLQTQFCDQALPLIAVRACQLRHLSFFVRLADQHSTLREAMGAYLQLYHAVVGPKLANLERDQERGTDTIVIDWWDNPEIDASLEFRCVFGAGINIQTIRALLDDPEVGMQAVHLTCPENEQFLDEYEAFFGGPVTMGADQNRLVFSSEVFDRYIVRRGSASLPLLDDIAGDQIAVLSRAVRQANHLVDRVRDYVREHLGASSVDQKTAARDMAMSPRTLHRKLQEGDRSFRDLTVEVRTQRARELLADPDYTIQQVAHALGYSQPSSFHRAFKRWTGQTPGQARRDLLGET